MPVLSASLKTDRAPPRAGAASWRPALGPRCSPRRGGGIGDLLLRRFSVTALPGRQVRLPAAAKAAAAGARPAPS